MMSGAALMRCHLVGALLLSPACTASRGPAVVPIAEVQGVGQASPMAGRTVTVEGVVVGGSVAGLGGFFVQDPEGDADTRPIERLPWWIEDVLSPETPLRAGSVIRAVTGVVDQRRGQTRLQVIEEVSTIDQGTRPRPVDVPGDTRIAGFNAYAQEKPIRVLLENGWHDALAPSSGQRPYTCVYNEEAGRLDHALLSGGLAARLAGARVWHSNADEVPLFGYESGIDTSAYRASDHDPILLGLALGER